MYVFEEWVYCEEGLKAAYFSQVAAGNLEHVPGQLYKLYYPTLIGTNYSRLTLRTSIIRLDTFKQQLFVVKSSREYTALEKPQLGVLADTLHPHAIYF